MGTKLARKTDAQHGKRAVRTNILGVRMTSERLVEVKTEAARRQVTISQLFDELWAIYQGKR